MSSKRVREAEPTTNFRRSYSASNRRNTQTNYSSSAASVAELAVFYQQQEEQIGEETVAEFDGLGEDNWDHATNTVVNVNVTTIETVQNG